MGDVLTIEELRTVMERVRDAPAPEPCRHIVHPREAAGRRLAFDAPRDGDIVTGCAALCGATLVLRRV